MFLWVIASARFPGEMKGPRCELMLSGWTAAVLKERDAAASAQLRGRRQTEPRRLHQLWQTLPNGIHFSSK